MNGGRRIRRSSLVRTALPGRSRGDDREGRLSGAPGACLKPTHDTSAISFGSPLCFAERLAANRRPATEQRAATRSRPDRGAALWRPHARRGYHRGPPRHPEDSHPPRAPERGASAPAAAVRLLRLELARRTYGWSRPRADAPGAPIHPCQAPPDRPAGFGHRAWRHGEPPPATPARRSCAASLRNSSGLVTRRTDGWVGAKRE